MGSKGHRECVILDRMTASERESPLDAVIVPVGVISEPVVSCVIAARELKCATTCIHEKDDTNLLW